MIVQNVDIYAFHRAFEQMGRHEQFSREAREALFEYLEEYSESCGEPYELDVIAICCDFSEYDSAAEAAECSGWERPERDVDEDDPEFSETEEDYEDRCEDEAKEWLQERTVILELSDGGVVIQQF